MLFSLQDVLLSYPSAEQSTNDYHHEEEPVMLCNCPPQCDFFSYETNMVPIPISQNNDIILDVHFDGPTSIRYRMEVVFTSQNLLGMLRACRIYRIPTSPTFLLDRELAQKMR